VAKKKEKEIEIKTTQRQKTPKEGYFGKQHLLHYLFFSLSLSLSSFYFFSSLKNSILFRMPGVGKR